MQVDTARQAAQQAWMSEFDMGLKLGASLPLRSTSFEVEKATQAGGGGCAGGAGGGAGGAGLVGGTGGSAGGGGDSASAYA
eukprot:5209355-Prymnesium_polylepis.1